MITLFDIESTRTLVKPWFGGTLENGWRDATDAVFDLPRIENKELVRRFENGEETPGYTVKKTVLGVGTTVSSEYRWVERPFDSADGDSVLFAVYLDPDGKWIEISIWNDYNRVVVDAPDSVVEARKTFLVEAEQRRQAARVEEDRRRRNAEVDAILATPRRGKFVRVSRGRRVAPGLVGVAFWEGIRGENGTYPTESLGIAKSPRKDIRDRYSDREYVNAKNLDVLLQSAPSDPRELAMLYVFSSSLFVHVIANQRDGFRALAEVSEVHDLAFKPFSGLWKRLSGSPWVLAALDAFSPFELPRVSKDEARSVDEFLEAIESMDEVRDGLDRLAEARLEAYMASMLDDAEAWREKARTLIEQALPTVYMPKKKAKRSKAATRKSL